MGNLIRFIQMVVGIIETTAIILAVVGEQEKFLPLTSIDGGDFGDNLLGDGSVVKDGGERADNPDVMFFRPSQELLQDNLTLKFLI